MQIYTSYFANLKTLEEAGIYCVSICSKVPDFFEGPNLESVAPNKSILYEYKNSEQTDADKERYKQRYENEVLCAYRFHPEYLIDSLAYFSSVEGNKDVALLCYERPEDFCHRHILADWLNERLDVNIIEYPEYPKAKDVKLASKKQETMYELNTLF